MHDAPCVIDRFWTFSPRLSQDHVRAVQPGIRTVLPERSSEPELWSDLASLREGRPYTELIDWMEILWRLRQRRIRPQSDHPARRGIVSGERVPQGKEHGWWICHRAA